MKVHFQITEKCRRWSHILYGEEQFVANDMVDKSELCLCKFPENMSKSFAGQTTNWTQPKSSKIIDLFKLSFQIMKLEF